METKAFAKFSSEGPASGYPTVADANTRTDGCSSICQNRNRGKRICEAGAYEAYEQSPNLHPINTWKPKLNRVIVQE
jgi:hypothetical protein